MRKAISIVIILVSLLSFRPGRAQAAGIITYQGGQFVLGKGIVFVFTGSGFRNRDLKNANIFAGSNFHHLSCSINKGDAKIVCVVRGGLTEFAGETAIIYLGRQIFYVTVPGRNPLRCGGLDALGADVEFEDVEGSLWVEFVPGQTLEAVQVVAAGSVSENEYGGYRVLGSLYCEEVIEEPVEEPVEEPPEEPEEEPPEEPF
jgi:hypothetical protein